MIFTRASFVFRSVPLSAVDNDRNCLDVDLYGSANELVFRYRWASYLSVHSPSDSQWTTRDSTVRATLFAVTYNDQAASAALSDLLQELDAPEWLWRFFAGDADWWQSTPHAKAVPPVGYLRPMTGIVRIPYLRSDPPPVIGTPVTNNSRDRIGAVYRVGEDWLEVLLDNPAPILSQQDLVSPRLFTPTPVSEVEG